MFNTSMGAVTDESNIIYLYVPPNSTRYFVNYLNVPKTGRENTFGIVQTGKAFRNEIVARQFIFFVCVSLNKWKCNFL